CPAPSAPPPSPGSDSRSIAQHLEQGPRGLGLTALGAQRLRRRAPAVDVEVGEAARAAYEPAQEQGGGHRPCERLLADVVHVGNGTVEARLVARPEGHTPDWIAHL